MSNHSSDQSRENHSAVIKSNFICVFSILLFAMGFPAAEYLLDDWDVVSVITARNLFSFILIFLIWISIEGVQKVKSAKWLKGTLIGVAGFGIGAFLILYLQSLTSPVIAALAVATMPVFAVSLEMLLDGRKMTVWFFCGVTLVLWGGYIASGASLSQSNIGFAILIGFLGVALFAWGSRATVKSLPDMTNLGQVSVTSFGMAVLSIALYIICTIFMDLTNSLSSVTLKHIGLVLIYAWLGLYFTNFMDKGCKSVGYWYRLISFKCCSFLCHASAFYIRRSMDLAPSNRCTCSYHWGNNRSTKIF